MTAHWTNRPEIPKPTLDETSELLSLCWECNLVMGDDAKEKQARDLDHILGSRHRPFMLLEYGFGYTTYQMLEWCCRHDGYLVTVDKLVREKPKIPKGQKPCIGCLERRRRNEKKLPHARKLQEHAVGRKHWMWLSEDIFGFSKLLLRDSHFRETLFWGGKVHYFYEDAIWKDEFMAPLCKGMARFMQDFSVIASDGARPTRLEFPILKGGSSG